MNKLIMIGLLMLLSGCVSRPDPQSFEQMDNGAVQRQQTKLQALTQWQLRGQIAVYDLRADERQAIYMDWHTQPQQLHIRFSHPLGGTVAQLTETPAGATLTDEDGVTYNAPTANELLSRYFGLDIPFHLFRQLLIGQQLATMQELTYVTEHVDQTPYALLSQYQMRANGESWRGELGNYAWQSSGMFLPQRLELISATWRIKLRVTKWTTAA